MVRIYVEGGFESLSKGNCRKAFRMFFERTLPVGSVQVIASGDRGKTYKDFCRALVDHPDDYIILLVDSEEPVSLGPWEHVAARQGDNWVRPAGAEDDQAHLMVQVMESWFLADKDALKRYYGQHFQLNALPRRSNTEQVSKADVLRALGNSTRNTQKGVYHKTKHAFLLLELIDPVLVRKASRHADRLLTVLTAKTSQKRSRSQRG